MSQQNGKLQEDMVSEEVKPRPPEVSTEEKTAAEALESNDGEAVREEKVI